MRPLLAALTEAQFAADAVRGTIQAALRAAPPAAARYAANTALPVSGPGTALLVSGPAAVLAVSGLDAAAACAAADRAAAGAAASEAAAAGLQYLADTEATLPARAADLRQLREAADAAASRAAALEAAKRELPERIAGLASRLAEARIELAAAEGLQGQLAATEHRHSAAVQLTGLVPQLHRAEQAARSAVDAHQRLVDAFQQQMAARLTGMAAELAAGLAAGVSCPVCGSTAHPAPARPGPDAVTEQDLADSAGERDAAETERRRAENERDELAAKVAAAAAVAAAASADALAGVCAALTQRIESARLAAAAAELLEPELADRQAEQELTEAGLLAAAAAASVTAEQAGHAERELATVTQEVVAAAQEHSSVAARQLALAQAARADRTLATALDELAGALAGQRAARDRARKEALARGFPMLELAGQAVLAPQQLLLLEQEVTSWHSTLTALQSAAGGPDLGASIPVTRLRQPRRPARRRRPWTRPRPPSGRRARLARRRPAGLSGCASGSASCALRRTALMLSSWPRTRSFTWPGWPRGWTGTGGWH